MNITLRKTRMELKRRISKSYMEFKYPYIKEWIFIHINKTGGTSIERALGRKIDHQTALEKKLEIGDDAWRKRFKFSVVRNPWSKVVSQYHYFLMTDAKRLDRAPDSFSDWVKLAFIEHDPLYYNKPKYFQPQCDWLCDSSNNLLVDVILKQESLNSEFEQMCSRFGTAFNLPHIKKTNHQHYSEYYDDQSISTIGETFHQDILKFQYKFENQTP